MSYLDIILKINAKSQIDGGKLNTGNSLMWINGPQSTHPNYLKNAKSENLIG